MVICNRISAKVDVEFAVFNANTVSVPDKLDKWRIQSGQAIHFRAFAIDPDKPISDLQVEALVNFFQGKAGDIAGDPGEIYQITATGKDLLTKLSTPIYSLGQDRFGAIWATTGGGALVQLDRNTGSILRSFGDSITQALAIDDQNNQIYVSSGDGIDIFDITTQTFKGLSSRRVDSLALDSAGNLWATSWPERGQILKFDAKGDFRVVFTSDHPLDSIAFGKKDLAGLLFASSNDGTLTAFDLATKKSQVIATGGLRGENLIATADGKLLLSQGSHVDLISPIVPPKVLRVTPTDKAWSPVPVGEVAITFDRDLYLGKGNEAGSALNPNNYVITGHQGAVKIEAVRYEASNQTVYLKVNSLASDQSIVRTDL